MQRTSNVLSAASEISLLWLTVFNEFNQKQMWNSTSGSLSPASLLLCLGHHLCPGHWSTCGRRCWWLWDFPALVWEGLMKFGERSPTPEGGQTHGSSTSCGNISVGGPVLHRRPICVLSWSPSWCQDRGVAGWHWQVPVPQHWARSR